MPDEFTREYSKRLGVLTGAQLQAALTRFDLGELRAASPAPGGLFGQNVFLSSTAGEFVLRGDPHYDGQFEKERYFCRVIAERTEARAPWPFLIEKSPEIFGWSYALMPKLPGIALSDRDVMHAMTAADKIGIARAMGEHLRLIQQATWPEPAGYDHATDRLAPAGVPAGELFRERTRWWLAQCRTASAATTDADVAWVESIIADALPVLDAPFQPVLVHTDYTEGNVVAERGADGWRICGVFDLGEAYFADGDYDLARLACTYGRSPDDRLRALIDGYTRTRPLAPLARERMAFHIVTDRLIIWEYGQRNNVWFTDPAQTFRDFAEPFVAIADAIAQM